MQIVNHTGHCCGMNTIYGFPSQGPSHKMAAIPLHYSGLFCGKGRPEETAAERVTAMIRAQEIQRHSGILEVVLTAGQAEHWADFLTNDLHFKEVNRQKNSNSSNIIIVYHRNSGSVPKIEEPPQPKPEPVKEVAPSLRAPATPKRVVKKARTTRRRSIFS